MTFPELLFEHVGGPIIGLGLFGFYLCIEDIQSCCWRGYDNVVARLRIGGKSTSTKE